MSDPYFATGDEFGMFGPAELLRGELGKDEKLLWQGQPRPGRAVVASLPIVIFGIPWTLFSLFWEAMALGAFFWKGGDFGGIPRVFGIVFPLFGLPFVLIGFGMLSAPYWAKRRAKRTVYALTDRRAILFEPTLFRGSVSVTSILPGEMQKLTKILRGDGSGDLILSQTIALGRHNTPSMTRVGFFGIDDVGEVERLIRSRLLLPI